MKKLNFSAVSPLSVGAQKKLADLTQEIVEERNTKGFEAAASLAKEKWGKKPKAAFREVKKYLEAATVSYGFCNYCEESDARDIEHVWPKSLFPEKCFMLENYVLACPYCNQDFKKDRFALFASSTGSSIVELPPKTEPSTGDSVFINPHVEDPLEYLELDVSQFLLVPKISITSRMKLRGNYTTDVLGINTRRSLLNRRRNAFDFYCLHLDFYVKLKQSTTFEGLQSCVPLGLLEIDSQESFAKEKKRVCNNMKNRILGYSSPTVWECIKRQATSFHGLTELFDKAPEAKSW